MKEKGRKERGSERLTEEGWREGERRGGAPPPPNGNPRSFSFRERNCREKGEKL